MLCLTVVRSLRSLYNFGPSVFSTTKNFPSTFKIRSRLGEFFKHVHPDQLNQAPTNVREENLRSLTNLNAYIDAINHSKPIDAKTLKFYLAEKTNLKSKKFYAFNIQLPQVKNSDGEMTQQKAKNLIDSIVDALNRKFEESKGAHRKSKKRVMKITEVEMQEDVDQPNYAQQFRQMTEEIGPFDKKQRKRKSEEQHLRNALNAKYLEVEKESLSHKLRRNIAFAETAANKPLMWSRVAMQHSNIYKDYGSILENVIDPRLIYFDEALSLSEIQVFKQNLLPGTMDRQSHRQSRIIDQLCQKMESFEPPICFYVMKEGYSATRIPGFFAVPFNFAVTELASQFEELIDTILSEQQQFEQFYDYYKELATALRTNNGIAVDVPDFRNNEDVWMRILALKRLSAYDFRDSQGQLTPIKVVLFDREQHSIFKANYAVADESSVVHYQQQIVAAIDFVKEDMDDLHRQYVFTN